MSQKISDMPNAGPIVGDELVPLVQALDNVKTAVGNLRLAGTNTFRQVGEVPLERWYCSGNITGLPSDSSGGFDAAKLVTSSFVDPRGGVIDRIGINVVSAGTAGTKARIGIWANTGPDDLTPTELLWESGEFDCGSTGEKTQALYFTLEPGVMYHFGFLTDSNANFLTVGPGYVPPVLGSLPDLLSFALGWSVSQAYGPMPDPFPSSPSPWPGDIGGIPRIGFRYRLPSDALVEDDFFDDDGTVLDTHDIAPINLPATAWTIVKGNFDIEADVVHELDSGWNMATTDPGISDCKLTATIEDIGANPDIWSGVLARCSDDANGWIFALTGSAICSIIELAAGVYTVKATGSFTHTTGVDYALSLDCRGDVLTGSIDGVEVVSYTGATSNQTVTKHGLNGYFTSGTYEVLFKKFEVEE